MISENDSNQISQSLFGITAGVLGFAVRRALGQVDIIKPHRDPEPPSPEAITPASPNSLPDISLDQVSWHDNANDCWIIVYDRVYDVTSFLYEHAGGEEIILEYAGRDATFAFRGVGHTAHAWRALDKYLIGQLPVHERIFKNGSEKIFENLPLSPNVALSAGG